ncbi:MAG: DUF1549 domain-containing protein [Planctomycetota bacterium]|nr:DUF1549 domain-containing protein [Planctomycetota bacterium]
MKHFALIRLVTGLLMLGVAARSSWAETHERISDAPPVRLEVIPAQIALAGQRGAQQVLVTGVYADGTTRDLTRRTAWEATPPTIAAVDALGRVVGKADGTGQLAIRVAGLEATVPLSVTGMTTELPVSFRREVMPVLSAAGCSDIRCHGAPSGKNGFLLSLWGFDPEFDFRQLTRDAFGRRTNALDPANSLIVLKPVAAVPHVGGRRFSIDSTWAIILRNWQREGLLDDPQQGNLESISVTPDVRVLHAPADAQQLAVYATFADGSSADVTQLAQFTSSDLGIAGVEGSGLVRFHAQGEVAILCRYQGAMVSARLTHIAPPRADYVWKAPALRNRVDEHVFAKLKMLNLPPSNSSDDAAFMRRVTLDLCGRLPTVGDLREFLADGTPDKRARAVDRLLQRPEFAEFWTKKWMDVLRVSRDSIQLAGAQAYQKWLRERIAVDASFAGVVQELLTAEGESYGNPEVNYYCVPPTPKTITDPLYLQKDLAESTAQLFLGVRLQCAQCHNHPFERWTQDDYLSLAAFFTQVKRTRLGKAGPSGRPDRRQMAIALDLKAAELVPPGRNTGVIPHFPGEPQLQLPAESDRRQALANWLVSPGNGFFAKAVANRIWYHLHGRGIVEPVDDMRDTNPSVNDRLLEWLAHELVRNNYQLTPLIRSIVLSETYQLAAQPNDFNRKDGKYFSHMTPRPLPAEVLLDAICDVTGVPETFAIMKDYTIGIPTETLHLPRGTRAVQLPVNDIVTLINTSGKYVRYESHPFLRVFGQPNRTQTCECDREQTFSRKKALELIIGPLVSDKLTAKTNILTDLLARRLEAGEILETLYRRALSRQPTPETAAQLIRYVTTSDDARSAWEDILWTLLNSQEFIYQH